ncbi:MAG TPA: winged helix-turn-helix domain-containing protein, partial [Gammaproteobacteria bacterium]|nr:winged helix-turn-helix domain-containing protein [Gammaproteobacteria bacterium]
MTENGPARTRAYRFGPYRLDAAERRLERAGEALRLPRKAFDLLLILVAAAGRLKTREELVAGLWPDTIVGEQGLSARVYLLRRALGDEDEASRFIETVRGVGYRFVAPVTVETPAAAEFPTDPAPSHRRGFRLGIGAVVVIAVAIAAGIFLWRSGRQPPAIATTEVATPSIAVLPFENLSADPANAYFARGIQDEILTRLAGIGSFKVISRTSTERYANHPQDLRRIGRELGVTTVLEGSVQKSGNEVHINVQLIDARTLAHIWARSYDRKLTNVFGVEGEVAGEVAEALNVRLTDPERTALAARPTENPAAYDAYLRGLAYGTRGSLDLHDDREAVHEYLRAVRLDPRFAVAWARLAMARMWIYQFYEPTPAQLDEAHAAITTALRLAPDLGEAWLAEGIYRDYGKHDLAGALAAFERARERLPNSAEVLARTSYVERDLGHWKRALALQQQAAQLDPRNVGDLVQWSLTYSCLRQFSRAHAVLGHALDLAPDRAYVIATVALFYQAQGDLDTADEQLRPLPFDPNSLVAAGAKIRQLLYRRDYPAAIAMLKTAIAHARPGVGNIVGYYYAMLG